MLLIVASAAVPIRAGEADDQFAVAAGHYAQRRWELAVTEFRALLAKYADHPKAGEGTFFLAEALLQTGDTEGAGEQFRRYLDRRPDGRYARAALFRAGEAAYLAGQSERAKTLLRQFRSKYPNDKLGAYVLPYLGDLALGQADPDEAIRYFQAGLTLFPQGRLQDDCRFGLARGLERRGRNGEAEKLYREVAAKPDSSLADDARCHLGILQYATGKYAEAIATFAAFETTLADSPWRSNARLGHGWALRKLGRLDDAKAMLRTIASDPMVGVEARYWLGIVERMQQDWAAAAKSMDAAARAAGPGHKMIAQIHFHAGDSLLRAGAPKEAAEQFEAVIAAGDAENEWIDDAICGRVQAALELKDHQQLDRAAAEFERRFPQSRLQGDVHRARAQSLLQRKQYAQAAKLIEPLVTVGTGSQIPAVRKQGIQDRYVLALAYQGMQRNEEALAVVLPVLDSESIDGPLKADALLMQGTLLVSMQRYADAVKPLESFLAANPTGDAAIKGEGELAVCYARTGRLDTAKEIFARLLQSHAGHELILPATEQLAEAAYAAESWPWAAELFGRLRDQSESKEYSQKGLAGLAWCQFKMGQLDESAVTFGKLLDAGRPPPGSPAAEMVTEAALARGGILERLGQSDPALAMYDLVIDDYAEATQRPQAMLAAARLRDKLQQDRESAALYGRLAKEYPTWAPISGDGAEAVLYEWAWVLDELGKTDESTELFRRLHKDRPQGRYWADATYRLARRAYLAQDYARASELVAQVLAGSSENLKSQISNPTPRRLASADASVLEAQVARIREDALDLRGHIAVAQSDWQRVEAAFGVLIEEYPETPKRLVAEYYIADAAYLQEAHEEAARRFEQLRQKTRGRRETWLAIVPLRHAQALAQIDRWSEAYDVAAKIEAEYPNFQQQFEADYLLGRCLAARADLEGARDAYQKVIRSPAGAKTETAAMAQLMIAETYLHQKNYQSALREYWRVEMGYAYPVWQALALLQVGKCHEKLDEWKKASEAYARLLKAYPKTEPAKEASQRLRTPPKSYRAAKRPD